MAITWDKMLATAIPVLYGVVAYFLRHDAASSVIAVLAAVPGYGILVKYWLDPDTGMGTGYHHKVYITAPTPGIFLAAFGWIWMLGMPAFILFQMSKGQR